MARLTRLLVTQFNSNPTPNGNYMLFRSNQILKLADKPQAISGYSTLTITKLDGSKPDYVEAASAASAILTAMNAADGTNSLNEILLTVIPATGSNYTQNVNIGKIHQVFVDPLNAARSFVAIEDAVGQRMTWIKTTSTLAAIATAANS